MSEVIIDGCNVSGCCCFEENMCLWIKRYYENPRSPKCEEVKDCYFKQLQRAKAENEKLKKEIKDLNFYIDSYKQVWEVDKYRKALEKIKSLNSTCACCTNPHVCGVCADAEGKPYESYKIANEVLNEK